MKRITDGEKAIWKNSIYKGETLKDIHEADNEYLPYLLDRFKDELDPQDEEAITDAMEEAKS